MVHFFVKKEQIGDDGVAITGPDVNHIRNVLRMSPGERLLISDGKGGDYLCEIVTITSQEVKAKIVAADEMDSELPVTIFLFQGFPKGDKMELIIQKAVELGVFQVIPVMTKRTVVRLDAKKAEARIRRYNAISESAAKQSGRRIIPAVADVMSFPEALEFAACLDVKVIPYEHADDMAKTREILAGIRPGMSVGVFIGPEGGFEESEAELARERSVHPITLGRRILRTETAGLAVLSVLMVQAERAD